MEEELMKEELLEEEASEEELIKKYGEIPEDIHDKPETYEIKDAIEGTLEEDKDVIFDEIGN